MALSLLNPKDAAPNTGLAAVALHHMRNKGGIIDDPDSPSNSVRRGSPDTSPSIENENNPYSNMPPLSLYPNSMLAHQMLGSLVAGMYVSMPNWYSNPTSPPPTPVNKSKRNNNNLETNGTGAKKILRRIKTEENPVVVSVVDPIPNAPLSPPTSGSSPQSNASGQEINFKSAEKDTKSFTCKICKRSFGYKHVLQNHERTHTGEKPFECKECHRRFTRDHHLKTHIRLHTGEKPYQCTQCNRLFVQVANLRRHLRTHTGEKPFVCQICSLKFSDSNQLKSHKLTHSGEKPFRCESCGAKFGRKQRLQSHRCKKLRSVDMDDDSRSTSLEIDENVFARRCSITAECDPLKYVPDSASINNNNRKPRERKSRDIRRVIRPDIPEPILNPCVIPPLIPEQTEPEDLSVPKSKLKNLLTQNNNQEVRRTRGRNNYYSDMDSRSESPSSTSTSSLEKEPSFTSSYHHHKLRRRVGSTNARSMS